jgi:DNA-binding MarR family transcriptional regulator
VKSKRDPLLPMTQLLEEFLDLIFWRLNAILDQKDISTLEWAFMQRALHRDGRGVPFSSIMKATRQSKDNVRRAADSLRRHGRGVVTPDPEDRRARLFKLTPRGKSLTRHIKARFDQDVLRLLGARHFVSRRVSDFNRHLWHATGFLKSGDLADAVLKAYRDENRREIPDDTPLQLRNENLEQLAWIKEDNPEEPWF